MSGKEKFYRANFESRVPGLPTAGVGVRRYESVVEKLEELRPSRLLELGFGGQSPIVKIAELSSEVCVVDIVPDMFASLPENCSGHVLDLDEDLPFESNSFDCVLAMMIFEHLFDPFHSFSELARVLEQGGVAFVNLPNVASLDNRLRLLMGNMPMTSTPNWFEVREWDGGHLHYFTVSDVMRLAELVDLRVDLILPVGKFHWLKKLAPSVFCHEITYVISKPSV